MAFLIDWYLWRVRYALCLYNDYGFTWEEAWDNATEAALDYSERYEFHELDPVTQANEDMTYWGD